MSDPRLDALWARLWWVPPRLSVSAFAERYVVLSAEESARTGLYSCAETPYMREPMDAVSEPIVREVTFAGGTQLGKTRAMILNIICWAGRQFPGPGLLVGPSKDYAADMVRKRVRPALEGLRPEAVCREAEPSETGSQEEGRRGGRTALSSPAIAEAEGTALLVEMPRMNLWAVGTESLIGLKSRAIKFVLKTEVEDFAEGAEEQIEKRQATYRDRKTINDGNPGLESGPQWQNYLRGDRRRWQMPCPHCGKYQELVFDRLHWGREGSVQKRPLDCDELTVKETVRYVCARCACEIVPAQRWGMIQRGVWVPQGCEVEDRAGTPEACEAGSQADPSTAREPHHQGGEPSPGVADSPASPVSSDAEPSLPVGPLSAGKPSLPVGPLSDHVAHRSASPVLSDAEPMLAHRAEGGAADQSRKSVSAEHRSASPLSSDAEPRLAPGPRLVGTPTGPGWPTHRSYTMGHLASPFVEWWEVAWGFIRQKGRPSAIWVNSVLGLPYTPPGEELKRDVVKRRFVPVARGGFADNVVPAWARCLVGGIDVQHDGYWVLVEAWGFRARRSLVLDAAFVPAPKDEPHAAYDALRRILGTRYPLDGGDRHPGWGLFGAMGMGVSQYLIDTGDGPRTPEMYALVRALGRGDHGAMLEAAKGWDELGVRPYDETVAERDVAVEDRTEKQPVKLVKVSNLYWKEEISGHLLNKDDERGSGAEAERVKRMLLPAWSDDVPWMADYITHVCNERRVPVKSRGRVVHRWMPRYAGADNHLFDCHMLSRCCAEVLGLERRCWGFYGECAVGVGCRNCQ